MSHFTTLVIGEDPEALLAPYDENTEVESYRRYEEGEAEDYWWTGAMRRDLAGFRRIETEGVAAVRAALLAEFAERAMEWERDKTPEKVAKELSDYRWAGERAQRIEAQPMTWATLADLYNERWHDEDGERLYVDDEGRAYTMSTYNPKSKWDWYLLGGRWTGFFKLRDGLDSRFLIGEPGTMTPKPRAGWADQVRKADIDFVGMRAQAEAEAISEHAKVRTILDGIAVPQRWPHVREVMFPGDIEAARLFYREQPGVKALREMDHWADDPTAYYHLDAEDPAGEYVAAKVAQCDIPFAILTADGWAEKGQMGWWAVVTDEKDDWPDIARQIIDGAPDSALFSLYDLHI